MFETSTSVFFWCLLGLGGLTFLLSRIGLRQEHPPLLLLTRWLRWVLFAGLFTWVLELFNLSQRPEWVHFTVGLLLWLLLETGYNWLAIKALSQSNFPLFPKFSANEEAYEWLAAGRIGESMEWLKIHGFQRLGEAHAELFESTSLRMSIYESPDHLTRIQVLFVPKRTNVIIAYYSICTRGADDQRLMTDNHSMPFGGYYPDNWQVMRRPLIGSLRKLFRVHLKRLERQGLEPVAFEDEALQELNSQQHMLEHLNTEHGFLNPLHHAEENGRLTYDGRYRLWKEMWLLAYLGKHVSG